MDDNKTVFRGVADQDKTVISKILQRFRPIAPKPTLNNFKIESFDTTKRNKRSKRRYVRVKNHKNGCDKEIPKPNFNKEAEIITLQLFPEKEENQETGNFVEQNDIDLSDKEIPKPNFDKETEIITLQLFPEKKEKQETGNIVDQNGIDLSDKDSRFEFKSIPNSIKEISSSLDHTTVESLVIVDCVIGINQERVLEVDMCPWFMSDWLNRVYWANRAYRRMMGEPEGEVKVWLVLGTDLMDEIRFVGELYGAVTCRVRVRYEVSTWKKEKSSLMKNMTMLCDVYKMGSNGFAWRLDVESALKLSI